MGTTGANPAGAPTRGAVNFDQFLAHTSTLRGYRAGNPAQRHRIGHDIAVEMHVGRTVTPEKAATIFTGRNNGVSEPATEATRQLNRI